MAATPLGAALPEGELVAAQVFPQPTESKRKLLDYLAGHGDPEAHWRCVRDHMYYDRYRFTSTRVPRLYALTSEGVTLPGNIRMFEQPISNLRGISDTNMHMACRLPIPNVHVIDRVHCMFSLRDSCISDVDRFTGNYVLHLWIGEKRYGQWPLRRFPVVGELNLEDSSKRLGEPYSIELTEPVLIPEAMTFHVELQGEPLALDRGIDMMVGLDGITAFAIQ